jgi:excisionase family DNA binding protein
VGQAGDHSVRSLEFKLNQAKGSPRPARALVWTQVGFVLGEDMMSDTLVLSVSEAAQALGVSDDLVYSLTERGDLPCLRFGRRKVIPRRAIELLIEKAMDGFDPNAVLMRLASDEDRLAGNPVPSARLGR